MPCHTLCCLGIGVDHASRRCTSIASRLIAAYLHTYLAYYLITWPCLVLSTFSSTNSAHLSCSIRNCLYIISSPDALPRASSPAFSVPPNDRWHPASSQRGGGAKLQAETYICMSLSKSGRAKSGGLGLVTPADYNQAARGVRSPQCRIVDVDVEIDVERACDRRGAVLWLTMWQIG